MLYSLPASVLLCQRLWGSLDFIRLFVMCLRAVCRCVDMSTQIYVSKCVVHAVCAGAGDRPNHYVPLWPDVIPTTPRRPVPRGGGEDGAGEGSEGGLPAPSLATEIFDGVLDEEGAEKKAASAPAKAKEEEEVCVHDTMNKPDPPEVCDD